jgi:predicted nucleotidyltransferase
VGGAEDEASFAGGVHANGQEKAPGLEKRETWGTLQPYRGTQCGDILTQTRATRPNCQRRCPARSLTNLRNMRNNVRNMRNTSVLRALFPQVRRGVLAATLTQPDKWWYLSELAGRLGTGPSSLQRELSSLVACGILLRRREGTRAYFKAETKSPVFRELRQLFEKTAGLAAILEQMLRPFAGKIRCAYIYGSMARGQEGAASDVDLMVIGQAGLADLSPMLRRAEARLGREVNATVYSEEEFRERIRARDHFLAAVLRTRKHFVKGSQSDLDEMVGK